MFLARAAKPLLVLSRRLTIRYRDNATVCNYRHTLVRTRPKLALCRSNAICHCSPARSQRFAQPVGRILRCLVLNFGIELCTNQYRYEREPKPHHQADARSERAIRFVVICEIRQIPREQGRSNNPKQGCHYRSHTEPAPLSFFPARSEAVQQREPNHNYQHNRGPPKKRKRPLHRLFQSQPGKHEREDNDPATAAASGAGGTRKTASEFAAGTGIGFLLISIITFPGLSVGSDRS
jgi:hypothetical protein